MVIRVSDKKKNNSKVTKLLVKPKENITDGFSSYLAILKKDGSQIITAPANYDSDDPKFKEYELFERLADNVEYYSWTYNVDQLLIFFLHNLIHSVILGYAR